MKTKHIFKFWRDGRTLYRAKFGTKDTKITGIDCQLRTLICVTKRLTSASHWRKIPREDMEALWEIHSADFK